MEDRSRFRNLRGDGRVFIDDPRPVPKISPESQPQPQSQPDPSPEPEAVEQPVVHEASKPEPASKPKKLGVFFGRRWLIVVIVILIAGLSVLSYGYIHTKNQLKQANNPVAAGRSEIDQIINQVNKSVELPTDETPTLATVNDASKLKNQSFFKNVQNGDKVLIYSKAGKALLYRPSTKKVIEYSLVSLNGTQ